MRAIIGSALSLGALALSPGTALAQDAAETAVITTATGPSTGRAQSSLGNAVSGSLNSAAGIIRSSARRGGRPARRGAVRVSRQGLPAGVDPLEGTDASAYKLDNGVTIKISGRMAPSAQARCVKDCESNSDQTGGVSVEKRPASNAAAPTSVTTSD